MLEDYQVNRCFVQEDFGEIKTSELHHFADASQEGYGCVSYIRLVNHGGRIHCAFIMGKAIVAPIKAMTIPRLELQAAVLAVKMNKVISREITLKVDCTRYWTDSQVVLCYIRNQTKRFKIFVANRLSKIHEGSSPDQ